MTIISEHKGVINFHLTRDGNELKIGSPLGQTQKLWNISNRSSKSKDAKIIDEMDSNPFCSASISQWDWLPIFETFLLRFDWYK